jgi:hypothetical protein
MTRLAKRWDWEAYNLKSHAPQSRKKFETDPVTCGAVGKQSREETNSNRAHA